MKRIVSWNVNGIRAVWKKGFPEWLGREMPDILCLQETKAHKDQLSEDMITFNGNYKSYFCSAEQKGYSGVACYVKEEPLNVRYGFERNEYDCEGRVIELEYPDFALYNVYFPNGGRGPHRVQYKLDFYGCLFDRAEQMRKQKHVIVVGDYNTAHKEIDLARPGPNSKVTGFLPEERAWIDKIIDMGYIDIFREYNKEPGQYTYWDQLTRARERNSGWRIDYFMIAKEMRDRIHNATIQPSVMGSDHCPVTLELE